MILIPTYIILVAALCATMVSVSAQQTDFPFQLSITRDTASVDFTRRSRGVNMMCLDPSTFSRDPIPNAIFWRHDRNIPDLRTPINSMPGTQTNLEHTVLSFRLSQEMEGNFSCGTEQQGILQRSNIVLLVARPISGLELDPPTTFAQAGERAVIPCGIVAGRAREQYRVTWTNGTHGPAIAQLPFPRQPQLEDSRYSVDPVDFSLSIDNVQVADDGNFYRCVVQVFFPPNDIGPSDYPQSLELPLKLTVYEPPAIIVPPRPQTLTTTQASTAVFRCSARGVPAPTITWTHKDQVAENGTKYKISPPITQEDENGNFVTSSWFEVLELRSSASGKVKCKASVASDEEIGDRVLPTAIEEVELIVLGGFRSIDVLVSPDKAVIYKINFEVPLSQTFHVFLNYTDEDNRQLYRNRSSPEGYSNAMSITHVEPDFRVPYPRFRVSVGIMVGGVVSPLDNIMQPYDLNIPSDTAELIRDTVTIAVAAAVPCFFIVIVLVVVCVLICSVCCYKRHQTAEQRIARLTRQLNKKLTNTKNPVDFKTKELLVQATYAAFDRIKPPTKAESDGGESGMTLEELQKCECQLLINFIRDSLEQGLRDEKLGPELKAAVEKVLSEYEEEIKRSGGGENGHAVSYEVVTN